MAGKRIAVVVPERWDGATVKEVARGLLQLSSTRLKKAKRLPDGTMVSPSLEDMFPFLDRKEMEEIQSTAAQIGSKK